MESRFIMVRGVVDLFLLFGSNMGIVKNVLHVLGTTCCVLCVYRKVLFRRRGDEKDLILTVPTFHVCRDHSTISWKGINTPVNSLISVYVVVYPNSQ